MNPRFTVPLAVAGGLIGFYSAGQSGQVSISMQDVTRLNFIISRYNSIVWTDK